MAARKNVSLVMLFTYPAGVVLFVTAASGGWQDLAAVSYFNAAIGGLGFAGLFGFCLGGGIEVVQHVTLRAILTCTGNTPWHYARFLNYCAERRLLQRVGGRYRFIHRELLDHFDPNTRLQ